MRRRRDSGIGLFNHPLRFLEQRRKDQMTDFSAGGEDKWCSRLKHPAPQDTSTRATHAATQLSPEMEAPMHAFNPLRTHPTHLFDSRHGVSAPLSREKAGPSKLHPSGNFQSRCERVAARMKAMNHGGTHPLVGDEQSATSLRRPEEEAEETSQQQGRRGEVGVLGGDQEEQVTPRRQGLDRSDSYDDVVDKGASWRVLLSFAGISVGFLPASLFDCHAF
jgi:hypothetical protein